LDDPGLTAWLDRLRTVCRDKDKTPARYLTALRDIDRATFDFATRSQMDSTADHKALARVLAALGRAERTLARGLRFCEDNRIWPLQGLHPDWLLISGPEDEWREFRLAAALASVRAVKGSEVGPLRAHLEEVEGTSRVKWVPGSTSAVWANRPLPGNLAAVFLRRWLETENSAGEGVALHSRHKAVLADVVAFINRETDDELLGDLLWALVGLDWGNQVMSQSRHRFPHAAPPREYALLRLLAQPIEFADYEGRWRAVPRDGMVTTRPLPAPFHLLGRALDNGQAALDEAIDLAARRLWVTGLVPFGWENRGRRKDRYSAVARLSPMRLLAACLFPLSRRDLSRLANRALNPLELVS
jgi:CRISPR-associated protein Csx17